MRGVTGDSAMRRAFSRISCFPQRALEVQEPMGGSPERSRILITGGSGFIGTCFSRHFDRIGHSYAVLDLHAPSADVNPDRFVKGDVRDAVAVEAALKGCTSVLHLAAAHHDSGIADRTYFDVNVGSSKTLIAAMSAAGLRRICFFSSAAVYGAALTVRDESFDPAPSGPYGESKWAAERLLRAASDADSLDVLVIRPSVTFGPNNFANMFSLMRQIDLGRFLHVGAGTNIKSLTYVENLVDFSVWAWQRHQRGFDVFNWVEEPDLTSRQIAEFIADQFGKSIPSVSVPLALALAGAVPFEILSAVTKKKYAVSRTRVRKLASEQSAFSSKKARRAGFVPAHSIYEGLAKTVSWYRDVGRGTAPVRRIPPHDVAGR